MTPLSLAAFQDAFVAALVADDPAAAAPPRLRRLIEQPGFAVYRNTVLAGCIDALAANYPTIERLVGTEWFRAAAAIHARDCLPSQTSLLLYGEHFPAFLAAFPPARELPYIAAVARVDRAWTEAHVAIDAPPLAPAALAALAPDDMACHSARPHPAARWVWSDDWPIHSLWTRNRTPDALAAGDLVWTAEGVLLTRPFEQINALPLDRGGAVFLDACAAGATLERAVAAALEAAPDTDIARLIEQLLRSGAFDALSALRDIEHEPLEAER